jgi:quercetin dioxygenase-like cupin family protein
MCFRSSVDRESCGDLSYPDIRLECLVMRVAAIVFVLCAACATQERAPVRYNEVPQRKEILANRRVSVSLLDLAPHQATPMHQHDRDLLAIYINGGHTSNTVFGHKPALDNMPAGDVRFLNAGYSHATENEGTDLFRTVTIEFAEPQGKLEQMGTTSHYCNPGSMTACVDEKNLFCTAKVCVEDVTIAPGAVTTKHSHTTDHMLVAVSDYQLADTVEGKGRVLRARRSGEVEYIPAGITHQMTNTGDNTGRFIVVLWR